MTRTEIPCQSITKVCPERIQMIVVITAIVITAGTNTPETRSAIFAIGALVAAASLTILMIWERVVSSPTLVASHLDKSGLIHSCRRNHISGFFINRDTLAGQCGFIDCGGSFQDHSVHRNILSRRRQRFLLSEPAQ